MPLSPGPPGPRRGPSPVSRLQRLQGPRLSQRRATPRQPGPQAEAEPEAAGPWAACGWPPCLRRLQQHNGPLSCSPAQGGLSPAHCVPKCGGGFSRPPKQPPTPPLASGKPICLRHPLLLSWKRPHPPGGRRSLCLEATGFSSDPGSQDCAAHQAGLCGPGVLWALRARALTRLCPHPLPHTPWGGGRSPREACASQGQAALPLVTALCRLVARGDRTSPRAPKPAAGGAPGPQRVPGPNRAGGDSEQRGHLDWPLVCRQARIGVPVLPGVPARPRPSHPQGAPGGSGSVLLYLGLRQNSARRAMGVLTARSGSWWPARPQSPSPK